MSNFYMILTSVGIAKIANAQITQETLDLTHFAVGDSNGTYYTPSQAATALVNEKWRGAIGEVNIDENNANWIVVGGVVPATVGGFTIREVGLFDAEGDMVAIGKVPESYKPRFEEGSSKDLYLKTIFEVSNASAVTLKVDPSIIIASKKYVDDRVNGFQQIVVGVQNQLAQHLEQYEYQVPTISGTQIRLTKQSNSNRLLFKLDSDLNGSISISTDAGATSKNLVDINGVPVTSLDKGFHEIVLTGNFFILRNKGGLSVSDLQALITITNEAEANESVVRTGFIDAVNDADASINLSEGATWNDILLQIPNIKTGRLSKEGNGDSIGSLLTISDIGFTPTILIWQATSVSAFGMTIKTNTISFDFRKTSASTSPGSFSPSSITTISGDTVSIAVAESRNFNWIAIE